MATTGAAPEAAKKLDELYEFDREPVTQDKLLGPGYFIGAFAGEHVAATEFVIGALFVNWGATVRDIFFGLVIGNLLAVLTWTFICAPIAVSTRLTLYWYLRRIGGSVLTLIYNIINAALYCVLAGCMITVSASAFRIPLGIPAQVNWYPTDWRFIALVLVVGAVVVALATLGFKSLATFAAVCSPWMFLMFISGAIVMLPLLYQASGGGSFLDMCSRVVWTGRTPDGSEPMGFWKVAAFAWICNLAMHGGLSDMAMFRYARKASYGLASITGMFFGHYVAWICAGLMGAGAAILVSKPLPQLDSGDVAYQALGWSGIFAVVFAGWTTSNPTLYRAGLALQAITPDWSRAKVTVAAGVITSVVACFPFVFTRLLDFVGLYGLLLSPAGAIVVAEHWLFPRLGLRRYWAAGRALNLPALTAWGAAILLALLLERSGTLHLFYLFLPVYTFTIVLYTGLAAVSGARSAESEPEFPAAAAAPVEAPKPPRTATGRLSGAVALAALVASVVLPAVAASDAGPGYLERVDAIKPWMLALAVLYFAAGLRFYRDWARDS
ncbi:MAG: nucleoside transporter [Acidobacteria bacterium]|nr:nucleoside transporter [Acidobacteriota bacterium]